ncbi:MAG: methionyl-tRNA formyltransferase [Gammaproteobacteria bacterium]|nr:methionyl-tRNA formyltransferase [Gammaproteobacteria bacterium]
MKLAFAGTPDFAVPALRALIDAGHDIVAVFTQPDRPAGRGQKLRPSPVKQLALDAGIPVFQPLSLKTEDAQEHIRRLDADVMVVVAYGLILPPAVLSLPRLGCLNIHGSLLPRWRGAAPIQRAIEAGDSETGITIIQMDVGLDTGAMLLKRVCPIGATDNAQDLHDRLANLGASAIVDAIQNLASRQLHPEMQDDALANYAAKLEKPEGAIDWHQPAMVIDRKIRAFTPWPGAYSTWQGKRLRILQAHPVLEPTEQILDAPPGTVTGASKFGIEVQTGEGRIILTRLQAEGAKPMATADFLNGNPMSIGQRFE